MSCCDNCPPIIPTSCSIPTTCPSTGFNIDTANYSVTLNMAGFISGTFIFRRAGNCHSYNLISTKLGTILTTGVVLGETCNPPTALTVCEIALPDPGDFTSVDHFWSACGTGGGGNIGQPCIRRGQCRVSYNIGIGVGAGSCRGCNSITLTITGNYTYYYSTFDSPFFGSFSATYVASFPTFSAWDTLTMLPTSIGTFNTFGPAPPVLGTIFNLATNVVNGIPVTPSAQKVLADYLSLPDSIMVSK